MSVDEQSTGDTAPTEDAVEVALGDHLNTETRAAQSPSTVGDQVTVNITDFGRRYHGVTKSDELVVSTFENGILIRSNE